MPPPLDATSSSEISPGCLYLNLKIHANDTNLGSGVWLVIFYVYLVKPEEMSEGDAQTQSTTHAVELHVSVIFVID